MRPHSFRHVSVWLDDGSSDESILPQALDCAFRLNLPLRVVANSSPFSSRSTNSVLPAGRSKGMNQSHAPVNQRLKAWSAECDQRGIVLEMFLASEGGEVGIEQFLRPHCICVFQQNSSSQIQVELLLRAARNPDIAILMCPLTCVPLSRTLVLYHQHNPDAAYLESAARVCRALEVQPVVLIVAKTEREAHLWQGYAEGVCNSFRLQADFDFVVGCELRSAVKRVASWRSCSHLIIERQNAVSWWQRRNGDLLGQLRMLSESLSILALPEAVAFDVPTKIRGCSKSLLRNGFVDTQAIRQ